VLKHPVRINNDAADSIDISSIAGRYNGRGEHSISSGDDDKDIDWTAG